MSGAILSPVRSAVIFQESMSHRNGPHETAEVALASQETPYMPSHEWLAPAYLTVRIDAPAPAYRAASRSQDWAVV